MQRTHDTMMNPAIEELLDRVASRGTMDVVHDLAEPFPTIMIAELLGVPAEDQARFRAWSDGLVDFLDPLSGRNGLATCRTATTELGAYFRELLAEALDDGHRLLVFSQFTQVLEMVRMVRGLGMEACCTLGMLTQDQANQLADAGLSAYNHNLDTSRKAYKSIITTRTFDDRLVTLRNVRRAGISVCSGGIIGMGESIEDRCELIRTLASLDPHPGSVPINALVPVEGTPLSAQPKVDSLDLVRAIATARIEELRGPLAPSAPLLEMALEHRRYTDARA